MNKYMASKFWVSSLTLAQGQQRWTQAGHHTRSKNVYYHYGTRRYRTSWVFCYVLPYFSSLLVAFYGQRYRLVHQDLPDLSNLPNTECSYSTHSCNSSTSLHKDLRQYHAHATIGWFQIHHSRTLFDIALARVWNASQGESQVYQWLASS